MNIKDSEKQNIIFRELRKADAIILGKFFESLSENTRSKFGPHPLTSEHAIIICNNISIDKTKKFVIELHDEIVGYFILDFNLYEGERERYKSYGIEIDQNLDPVFAPCIADKYQNMGLASFAMENILKYTEENNLRSILLMGGTQEPNILAQQFYKKFGFAEYGTFFTPHNNLNNIDMRLVLLDK